jgi:hypothetical protein
MFDGDFVRIRWRDGVYVVYCLVVAAVNFAAAAVNAAAAAAAAVEHLSFLPANQREHASFSA